MALQLLLALLAWLAMGLAVAWVLGRSADLGAPPEGGFRVDPRMEGVNGVPARSSDMSVKQAPG
jgi:hypothetical protein